MKTEKRRKSGIKQLRRDVTRLLIGIDKCLESAERTWRIYGA